VEYLAEHGANVIMGCRLQKNCDEAAHNVKKAIPDAALVSLELDLASFQSIKHAAEEVLKSTQKLHSLILNAGLYLQPYGLTVDGIEQTIGVNHFGHAYLVQLLEGLLKQTATKELPATIVVVSSAAHRQSHSKGVHLSLSALNDPSGYDKHIAYRQSKLANVLYAQELAERLRPFGILVNSLHPGLVESNVFNVAGAQFTASYPTAIDLLWRVGFVKWIRAQITSISWNVKDGALTQIYLAVSPEILSRRVHGKHFHPVARETPPDQIHATNKTLQKGLWDFTEEVLKSQAR